MSMMENISLTMTKKLSWSSAITSADIGKILNLSLQEETAQSKALRECIAEKFENIMTLVEQDDSLKWMIESHQKQPNTKTLHAFQQALLKKISQHDAKEDQEDVASSEKTTKNDPHRLRLETLGDFLKELYARNWYTWAWLKSFSSTATKYIIALCDIFADTIPKDDDDIDDDATYDKNDTNIQKNTLSTEEMTVIRIITSSIQSYMHYLEQTLQRPHEHDNSRQFFAQEKKNGRWDCMEKCVTQMRKIIFYENLSDQIEDIDYGYIEVIMTMISDWDAYAIEMNNISEE